MGRRVINGVSLVLTCVVALATVLYVSGIAPPFPLNAWAFNLLLLICTGWALLFGRAARPR